MRVAHRLPLALPRLLIGGLTFLTTACAAWVFGRGLAADGAGLPAIAFLCLFIVLFLWVSLSFWLATAGFLRRLRGNTTACGTPVRGQPSLDPGMRVAILMPVYNEDPPRVFAGLRAIYESLQATGHNRAFDFFVLSDTTNPDLWLTEELNWARLNQALDGG